MNTRATRLQVRMILNIILSVTDNTPFGTLDKSSMPYDVYNVMDASFHFGLMAKNDGSRGVNYNNCGKVTFDIMII